MMRNAADAGPVMAVEAVCREALGACVEDGEISLQFPKEGALRARRVVSRSGTRHTAKYPSLKMGRMMQAESVNELNAFLLLDADSAVQAFYEQPFTIVYSIAGTVHRHVPDVLVTTKGMETPQVWEIKESKELNDPLLRRRTRHLERYLPSVGYTYALIVAEDLRRGHLLANAKRLLRLGREPVGEVTREQIRRIVRDTGFISWDAVARGRLQHIGLSVLARLTLEGYLTFDRHAEILPTTQFYLNNTSNRRL